MTRKNCLSKNLLQFYLTGNIFLNDDRKELVFPFIYKMVFCMKYQII